MKVLHIFNEINFSGAEVMYANAASLFHEEGYELYAFSTGENIGSYVEQFCGASIIVSHYPTPSNLWNLFDWFRYMRNILIFLDREKIQVIHIHRSDVYWFFAFCAKIKDINSIWTVHNVFKNRKFTKFKAIIERYSAKKIFSLTIHSIGESVCQNEMNYYKNLTINVNNWFDNKRFFPVTSEYEKKMTRENIGIESDTFVIVSVGGCSYIKNHHDILKAVVLLKERMSICYIHLGTGHTEKEEIELAKQLGVYDNVLFLGNKDNVRDYLVSADLYVMTSLFEGLSISAIEAMACGLPCVFYDVPGLRDLIKNDDTGYLINSDYLELVDKITYLRNNETIREKKGSNACSFVNEHYSMKKSVKEICRLYTKGL